jgi:hypothetical protein
MITYGEVRIVFAFAVPRQIDVVVFPGVQKRDKEEFCTKFGLILASGREDGISSVPLAGFNGVERSEVSLASLSKLRPSW